MVGSRMITVFNDAKRGSLSAWSWPSREIAHQKAIKYMANGYTGNFEPAAGSFRYLHPAHHAELLDCIVETDRITMKDQFERVLSVSLHTDGSVDRMQQHNCHLMAKIVDLKGKESLLFLGFAESKERGPAGYLKTIKEASEKTLNWDALFAKSSSIVTDGENMSTGQHRGLCRLCQDQRDTSFSKLPLMKIWCAAQRMNLAWKGVF
eukprot:gene13673-15102_t